MPRPITPRWVNQDFPYSIYTPAEASMEALEKVSIDSDELEALRLADFVGLYQDAAARQMGISRPTFSRILERARKKVADVLLNGKVLYLERGQFPKRAPGVLRMKIAVPTQNELVDQHFGHAESFTFFTVKEDKSIGLQEKFTPPEGCGCKSDLANIFNQQGITHLIVGGIGDGAVKVMTSYGIACTKGASGNALDQVISFLQGKLQDSGTLCHHDQEPGSECHHHQESEISLKKF